MGTMSSLFGSKTKNKSNFVPWDQTNDYLLGGNGNKGIFNEASNLYNNSGFTPQMQDAQTNYLKQLQDRQGNFGDTNNPAYTGALDPGLSNYMDKAASDLAGGAYSVANGAYDTNYGPVSNVRTPQTNLVSARAGQGSLDPTQSLQKMLSGTPDNPYLDQQANAITGQLTRNVMQNIMPGIRSDALAAGQYGGSRQGIAEGNAISGLNQDLAPALTNLYGGAYENAQNRMFGTASQLNDQAYQNATNNANRNVQGQEFNANLGLQNNAQQMQQKTQNLNNRMQSMPIINNALGLLQGKQGLQAGNQSLMSGQQQLQLGGQQVQANNNNFQDQNFGQQMNALGMPQSVNAQNLSNYMGAIYPGAQLGGASVGTQTQSPGIVPAVLGTLSSLGGMASGAGMLGGAGSGGAGAGGFSSASRGFMGGAPLMFA